MRLGIGDEPIDLGVEEYPSAHKTDSSGSETLIACIGDEPVAQFAVAFYPS
jgi:hypothetical protein